MSVLKSFTLLTILVLVLLVSCSKDNDGGSSALDCSTVTNKAFAADVNPIIQSTCASTIGCHASGSTNGPGSLTTYSAIFNARVAIRSAVASGLMPQGSTLSTSQKIPSFAGLTTGLLIIKVTAPVDFPVIEC